MRGKRWRVGEEKVGGGRGREHDAMQLVGVLKRRGNEVSVTVSEWWGRRRRGRGEALQKRLSG